MVDPGNTLATALDLGILSSARSNSDAVNSLDPADFYRFSLTQNARVNLSLSGLSDSTRLELIADVDGDGVIDSGELITNDFGNTGDNAVVAPDLTAGTYYVRVAPGFSGDSTNYTLNLNPVTTPPTTTSNPGNTIGTALNIGTLSSPRSFLDNVGPLDPADFYRFSLTQNARVNLSLSGLSDNARLELIADVDADGVIDSGELITNDFGDTGDNAVVAPDLTAGTYYVRVAPGFSGDSTNYTLNLNPVTTPPTTTSNPGNTIGTALNIGTLSSPRSFLDNVGPLDPADFYRFSLTQNTRVNLSLSGLSDNARLELIADVDGDGVIDSGELITNDFGDTGDNAVVASDLTAGTYYVRVAPGFSGDSTNYTLNLNPVTTPPTTSSNPGNTIGTALNIGTLSSPRSFLDNVGPLDPADFYRFSLTQDSNVNLSLSGLSDNARLELISDVDGDGVIDFGETLTNDFGSTGDNAVISRNLAAGNYFVRVAPGFSGDSTNYSLDVFATTTTVSSQNDYIIGSIASESIALLAGNDRADGRAGNDTLDGGTGNDTLNGEEGNDVLIGGSGVDFLVGDLDNDILQGGQGSDRLTGGSGLDSFRFTSLLDRRDVITDFVSVDDTIQVSAAQFGGGLVAGSAISAAQFVLGTTAVDSSDRFIYNQTTGSLLFDVDGVGGSAQIQLAILSNRPTITRADIVAI